MKARMLLPISECKTHLHHISCRFQVISQYWSYYRFWQGAPLLTNALVLCNVYMNITTSHILLKKLVIWATFLLQTVFV